MVFCYIYRKYIRIREKYMDVFELDVKFFLVVRFSKDIILMFIMFLYGEML